MKKTFRTIVTAVLLVSVPAGARVAALTDEEVAALAGRVDELPAGGDAGVVLFVALIFVRLRLVEGAVNLVSTAVNVVRCGSVDALLHSCAEEHR